MRLPPPLVFLVLAGAGVLLEAGGFPLAVPLPRGASRALALALLAAGGAFVLSALVLMLRTGQNPEPWKPTPELIARGPYRFSRNPMYVGMALLQAGAGLVFANAWISALAVPALAVIHYAAVLPEERYLAAEFGQAYADYAARVRRYL